MDDGSPDNCPALCDAWAERDSRIRVVHQQNRGLGAARNAGLDIATGDYVTFIDSDDYLAADTFQHLMQRLEEQPDVDILEYELKQTKEGENDLTLTDKVYPDARLYWLQTQAWWHSYACNKIYRKELFEGIRYPKGRFYEDVAVTHKLVLKATKIWYSHKRMYYYRYREGSIVTTRSQKRKDDAFEMTMEQIKTLRSIEEMRTIANEMVLVLYFSYCISYEKDTSDERYCLTEKTIMALKPNIPQFFSRKQKIALILFWYCRPLFDFVCRLFNKRI